MSRVAAAAVRGVLLQLPWVGLVVVLLVGVAEGRQGAAPLPCPLRGLRERRVLMFVLMGMLGLCALRQRAPSAREPCQVHRCSFQQVCCASDLERVTARGSIQGEGRSHETPQVGACTLKTGAVRCSCADEQRHGVVRHPLLGLLSRGRLVVLRQLRCEGGGRVRPGRSSKRVPGRLLISCGTGAISPSSITPLARQCQDTVSGEPCPDCYDACTTFHLSPSNIAAALPDLPDLPGLGAATASAGVGWNHALRIVWRGAPAMGRGKL